MGDSKDFRNPWWWRAIASWGPVKVDPRDGYAKQVSWMKMYCSICWFDWRFSNLLPLCDFTANHEIFNDIHQPTTGLAWLIDSFYPSVRHFTWGNQGIVGCTPGPTDPVMGNPYISPIYWVFMGYSPQESQGWTPAKYHGSTRTLGVHPSLSLEGNVCRSFMRHLFNLANLVIQAHFEQSHQDCFCKSLWRILSDKNPPVFKNGGQTIWKAQQKDGQSMQHVWWRNSDAGESTMDCSHSYWVSFDAPTPCVFWIFLGTLWGVETWQEGNEKNLVYLSDIYCQPSAMSFMRPVRTPKISQNLPPKKKMTCHVKKKTLTGSKISISHQKGKVSTPSFPTSYVKKSSSNASEIWLQTPVKLGSWY